MRDLSTATPTEDWYYYVTNLQGDVMQLLDANGAEVAHYLYSAWGKMQGMGGRMAAKNPIRYRGYYYDKETKFYYLQSRYYDPRIGRFINADGYASTGQGILGSNMFAYCGNEPVRHIDLSGTARNTADDNNDNGIPDYLEEQWIELTNRWKVRLQGGFCRDVTDEVNTALEKATELGKLNLWIPFPIRLVVFKGVVDHNAPWDIKLQDPWRDTIKTEYPGDAKEIVIYESHYYTLEKLGNYTYGVLGKSYGFGQNVLFIGSMKAAGWPKPGTIEYDEEMADRLYIANGYNRGR